MNIRFGGINAVRVKRYREIERKHIYLRWWLTINGVHCKVKQIKWNNLLNFYARARCMLTSRCRCQYSGNNFRKRPFFFISHRQSNTIKCIGVAHCRIEFTMAKIQTFSMRFGQYLQTQFFSGGHLIWLQNANGICAVHYSTQLWSAGPTIDLFFAVRTHANYVLIYFIVNPLHMYKHLCWGKINI